MAFPASHKTVFVVDHSWRFFRSCGDLIELESLTKNRGPQFIPPLAPISKSLWTSSLEGILEYVRIIWDIYPASKLIRLIASDNASHNINSWDTKEQSVSFLMNSLSMLSNGSAQHSREASIMHGLKAAIESLCECSAAQHQRRLHLLDRGSKVLNRGRIICLTILKEKSEIETLESQFHDALMHQNKIAAGSDVLLPIHHCELLLINVHPRGDTPVVQSQPKKHLSALCSMEVVSVAGGAPLASYLTSVLLSHYQLASTTVTGIPMKEEQNASSSANYDVELFHPAASHAALLTEEGSHFRALKEGSSYETVTLKWSAPRPSSSNEFHLCLAAHRVTTVDVNSRPSTCLTNFLLNGRSVLLEMSKKGGGKVNSHMLTSHGGEIFIHTLATSKSILDDPPSISEGVGGRVTDYRIAEFGNLMKRNLLSPHLPGTSLPYPDEDETTPLEHACLTLQRHTKYWPITISGTYLYHLGPHVEKLLRLIVLEELNELDVMECKNVLYDLLRLESKGELLQILPSGPRGKSSGKREEHYKAMWKELEVLVKAHQYSPSHESVLSCLLDLKSKDDREKPQADVLMSESDSSGFKDSPKSTKSETVKTENGGSGGAKRSHSGVENLSGRRISSSQSASLFDLWNGRLEGEFKRRRRDFAGQLASKGSIAKLYANLEMKKEKEKNAVKEEPGRD